MGKRGRIIRRKREVCLWDEVGSVEGGWECAKFDGRDGL